MTHNNNNNNINTCFVRRFFDEIRSLCSFTTTAIAAHEYIYDSCGNVHHRFDFNHSIFLAVDTFTSKSPAKKRDIVSNTSEYIYNMPKQWYNRYIQNGEMATSSGLEWVPPAATSDPSSSTSPPSRISAWGVGKTEDWIIQSGKAHGTVQFQPDTNGKVYFHATPANDPSTLPGSSARTVQQAFQADTTAKTFVGKNMHVTGDYSTRHLDATGSIHVVGDDPATHFVESTPATATTPSDRSINAQVVASDKLRIDGDIAVDGSIRTDGVMTDHSILFTQPGSKIVLHSRSLSDNKGSVTPSSASRRKNGIVPTLSGVEIDFPSTKSIHCDQRATIRSSHVGEGYIEDVYRFEGNTHLRSHQSQKQHGHVVQKQPFPQSGMTFAEQINIGNVASLPTINQQNYSVELGPDRPDVDRFFGGASITINPSKCAPGEGCIVNSPETFTLTPPPSKSGEQSTVHLRTGPGRKLRIVPAANPARADGTLLCVGKSCLARSNLPTLLENLASG